MRKTLEVVERHLIDNTYKEEQVQLEPRGSLQSINPKQLNTYPFKKNKNRKYSYGDSVHTEVAPGKILNLHLGPISSYARYVDDMEDRKAVVISGNKTLDTWICRGFSAMIDKPQNDFLGVEDTYEENEDTEEIDSFYKIVYNLTTHKKIRNLNSYRLNKTYTELCQEAASYGFRQVSCGQTSFTRNVLVVDIDEASPIIPREITNQLDADNQRQVFVDYFNNFCLEKIGIKPSRVIINTAYKPGGTIEYHYQIHFFLNQPYICLTYRGYKPEFEAPQEDRLLYNKMIFTLNKIFGGDLQFRGSWCKNPFGYEESNLYTFGEGCSYDRSVMEEILNPYVEELSKKEIKKIRRVIRKDIEEQERLYGKATIEDADSRNCYAYNRIHAIGFKMMSRGELNSYKDLIEPFKELERESLYYNGKSCIEMDSEIEASCRGAYDHILRVYDPAKVGKGSRKSTIKGLMTNQEAAQEGKKVKQCINILRYHILSNEGLKKIEIAAKLNCSQNTITSYARADFEEAYEGCLKYWNLHQYSLIDNVRDNLSAIEETVSLLDITSFYQEEEKEIVEETREAIKTIAINSLPEEIIYNIFSYISKRAEQRYCIKEKPKIIEREKPKIRGSDYWLLDSA